MVIRPSATEIFSACWRRSARYAPKNSFTEEELVEARQSIEAARQELESDRVELARAKKRWPLARIQDRATEIAAALQDLELPAWLTLMIVDEAVPHAKDARFGAKWDLVVAVKHFHDGKKKNKCG